MSYKLNGQSRQILFCLCVSFLLLLICTRSSLLYIYNNWDDANSYFSVGKGIFNGKVPYRDIFDQKGMYLYFIYGIGYLFSHTTFNGIFVIELILGTIFNNYVFKILEIYIKRSMCYILMPFIMALIFSSRSFYWGGSAEEIMLPFLTIGLYILLNYFHNIYPEKMPYHTVFVGGVLAGVIANIKFNSLGFFFAWIMVLFFSEIFIKKYREAFLSCLIFLSGMLISTLPWVIYFACNHALNSWYEGYIYMNVFIYSDLKQNGSDFFERIYSLVKILYWLILTNTQYFIFIIVGMVGCFFIKSIKWCEKLSVVILCFFLFLGIYIGGVELPYYSLVISVFTVWGFVVLGYILRNISISTKLVRVISVLTVMSCIGIVTLFSMNTDYLSEDREDMYLTQFKEIITETENPTLLNCGCLDAGLYTVCDIVPNCRWFQTQTLPVDEIIEEQNRYIQEGKIDYVLVRNETKNGPNQLFHLTDEYDLISEQKYGIFTYSLYKKEGK